MVKNHMKKISAPRSWDILRKDNTFISRPNAGRAFEFAVSLNMVIKDMLKKVDTTKESKYLLRSQGVLVNGVRRYDEKFPVGFLDVVTFPGLKENYRLIVDDGGSIIIIKIPESEAHLKISKVQGKKFLSKELVQLNCTDGRNFNIKVGDALAKDAKINDTIVYTMPDQKIDAHLKLEKGAKALLYKGKHIGKIITVLDFKEGNVTFKIDDETFETKKGYAFVVGKDKQLITVTQEHGASQASGHKDKEKKPAAKKHKEE